MPARPISGFLITSHLLRGVDLTDHLCSPDRCDPVIGRFLVYRDARHLTSTFATALAEPLWDALRPAVTAGAVR